MVHLVGDIRISHQRGKYISFVLSFTAIVSLLFMQTIFASALGERPGYNRLEPIPTFVPFDTDSNISTYALNESPQMKLRDEFTQKDDTTVLTTGEFAATQATCSRLSISSLTASGDDGNIPSNTLDNNLNTRWSDNGVGSWIQLDLGSKKSICSVDIAWYRGNVRENNFVIAVSNDGTNFVNKFNGRSSGATTNFEKYNMPANTEGRYVRITVNGNTNNNWASITEIAIIGSSPTSTNQPPTADSKSVQTSMNTPIDITLTGKDPENGPLIFAVVDFPKSGKAAGWPNIIKYTPNTGFTGSDSFTYTAKDNKGAVSTKATVTISVTGTPGTNQPPTADSKSVQTSMNTPIDITLTGKDPENGPLIFAVVDFPKSGKAAGWPNIIKYTPNTGFTGSDSFTYTAKDNKGAVSAKATVSISVTSGGGGGGDAGQNDKFGIKKIYPSKSGGEQWFMNMQDPNNDPRTKAPSLSKNSDGSWRVTSGQVRYGVYTSSGYHPDDVVKDHSVIASRGYMQSPNDWKNIEMTGQVKYNSGGDDEWTWYSRGGRHTGSGWEDGCEGSAYKGSLAYTGGQVRWAKEQWHVSYVFQPWKNSPADGDGKFVGFKVVIYNMQLNGKTVVKMESWVDPNNNNQWQKVYDFIDQGGWGNEGGECRGASDQILTWGGPVAAFRWDDGNSIDIKNLSVREIVPPS